ncbi:MAG: NINE protein [Hormoscilla sp. GM102CHS1]|nr:NINE protein [Hormoscilla sp. GM102CHS1]
MNQVSTSYLLWLGCLFGVTGLHRIYNKKFATGILWLCTGGLLGIGQFIDLFLISAMVEEHNMRAEFRAKHILSPTGVPIEQKAVAQQVVTKAPPAMPTREQLMVKLLKAAEARGGKLSVTQGVMETGVGFSEVESVLLEMVQAGYVSMGNHLDTDIVIYEFHELQG